MKACLSGNDLYFVDDQFDVIQYDLLTSRTHHLNNIKSLIHEDYGFIAQIEYYDKSVYVALKNSGVLKVGRGYGDQSVWIRPGVSDRKSTRLNSSHVKISYAVFCLKKKK